MSESRGKDIVPGASVSAAPRAVALDAVRGIAILLMCLSGRIPFSPPYLSRWMYHGQEFPPNAPAHLPGITWVDFVFPLFLFSMGVAFPFALTSRLAKGASKARLALGSLGRMASLVFFAIYFNHVVPYYINDAATSRALFGIFGIQTDIVISRWVIGLIGFAIMFPVYMRFPPNWDAKLVAALRVTGIGLAMCLMYVIRIGADAKTASVWDSNIILIVLASMAFFGSVIWLLTPRRPILRLIFMIVGVYAHIMHIHNPIVHPNQLPGFLGIFTGHSPASVGWFFNIVYLKYLLVVLPATVIGDELLRWMKTRDRDEHLSRKVLLWVSLIAMALVLWVHFGLFERLWLLTSGISVLACTAMMMLTWKDSSPTMEFIWRLIAWGSLWLILGLAFEPFEGGIKKDPTTLSYYFVMLGLSIMLLTTLTIWLDLLWNARWARLLTDTGQNPMLAYMGINNLMEPIFALSPAALIAWVVAAAWRGAVWAVLKTLVLAGLTSVFTRLRIVWRT